MLPVMLLVAGVATCPISGSTYALDNDPSVSIVVRTIRNDPSHLYLTISDNSKRTMWFTLDRGSAQSSVRLVSSKKDPGKSSWTPQDPDSGRDREIADQRYFLFKADGSVDDKDLSVSRQAPNGIFLADLSETLFYERNPRLLSPFKRGIFRRKSCGSAI